MRALFCSRGPRWRLTPEDAAPGPLTRLLCLLCLLWLMLVPLATAAAGQEPTPELRERVKAALASAESFEDHFDATVWLTDMASRLGNQVPDPATRVEILTTAHREAVRNDLPPELVLAVIDIESAFNPYAVSSAGAQGLMQVMPFWRKELGYRRLVGITDNLIIGCSILRHYYDMEKGDWTKALARYNGSVGRRDYSQKVLDRLRTRWFQQ